MDYHISWIEEAIKQFKSKDTVHIVKGSLTIEEFLQEHIGYELSKSIEVK